MSNQNQNQKSRRDFLMMAGASLMAAAGTATAAESAFGLKKMTEGYEQTAMMEGKCGEGKCGGKMKKKPMEGKCGEGKCGGQMKKKMMEAQKAKKSQEGKCGNMHKKQNEGKCGGQMK